MQSDLTQLQRVVQSPEGQQLIRLLQKNDPDALKKAAAQAAVSVFDEEDEEEELEDEEEA